MYAYTSITHFRILSLDLPLPMFMLLNVVKVVVGSNFYAPGLNVFLPFYSGSHLCYPFICYMLHQKLLRIINNYNVAFEWANPSPRFDGAALNLCP